MSPVILFLTNADTEVLALRTITEDLPPNFPPVRAANPHSLGFTADIGEAKAVLVRLLGGRRSWEEQFDALVAEARRREVPLLAFGGEASPDAELTAVSTVRPETLAEAFEYLVQGGPANLGNLLRFVADEVLGGHFGYEPPAPVPEFGVLDARRRRRGAPLVGVVFYRAHLVAGNTRFVHELCEAIEAAGADTVPVYCYSLRTPSRLGRGPGGANSSVVDLLRDRGVDAVVTTVLAAGSQRDDEDGWDAGALAGLEVPVVQAICATTPSGEWASSAAGLAPVDVAMSVAIPEFDGRIVTVPFSFKEQVDDGEDLGTDVTAYRTVRDRTQRVAALVARLAALRATAEPKRKVAVVLSAYPTKRSRLGNAVGLDTPASVLALLRALSDAGYRVDRVPATGDELMAELADGLTVAEGDEHRPAAMRAVAPLGTWATGSYARWFATLPAAVRAAVESAWGPPPGEVGVEPAGSVPLFVFSGIDLGGVVVAVQPPRGFGHDPIAVYHSPDLPPTHYYLAFYRWLDQEWGAHAVVHMGKHGTLEWLPGKSIGLSSECLPDVVLGELPLVYPFVVNDPGEGTQAKRRSHAVIVDHLVPPLTRADTYDDLARLEALLDEHAHLAALDPAKLPALRRRVWDLLVEAEIHRDLGLQGVPGFEDPDFHDADFDELILRVDGYLCELKDAQIRGGLHVLGDAPEGPAELDMVEAITRAPQGGLPSLREVVAAGLGVPPERAASVATAGSRRELEAVETDSKRLLAHCQERGWQPEAATRVAGDSKALTNVLGWVCERLVPRLRATSGELDGVLAALDGQFVPPGPSGAPSRGMANVLPTGRNFYSIDPKAVPSPLAWEVGTALADRLVERHLEEEGRCPTSVGLVVWGTSAMRTGGDDLAEALALMGVRPTWNPESGRVSGVELISLQELGRPRVDVTLRVSGFFRDAFPHVLDLLDRAIELVASMDDEPAGLNPLAVSGTGDPRVFGPGPGSYGSGILHLLESGEWRDGHDLAGVYLAWGGWAYGRHGASQAPESLRRRLGAVEVAVKNQDNREHDIFDSDDYLQDHGGMVAAVRALSGRQPKAWFGDSADPARPRVRALSEEAARVVRSRVLNPKWIDGMRRHGYKGAFEMAATVDYLFGYDATAGIVEDWMYERVTAAYVGDPDVRKFFAESNPWALHAIAERLTEAAVRGMWHASNDAMATLRAALLEAEGWEEAR